LLLQINTAIADLNIADNWVTAEGMRDIADMLMDNCYITSLVRYFCAITNSSSRTKFSRITNKM